MTDIRITSDISVEIDDYDDDVHIHDACYKEKITLSKVEFELLRRWMANLEPGLDLKTANLEPTADLELPNLEPSPELGTEAPTWNQPANLEPPKSRDDSPDETAVRSRNETAEFRRALTLAVVPGIVARRSHAADIARETREIVDRITSELEGKN